MNLPRFSVHRPIFATMVTLIVVIIGMVAVTRLPIDLLPEIELPSLTVASSYANASPEEMERLVTELVEEAVATVPGVDEVVSVSGEGVSNVTVRFTWGTDIDTATNDVRDRVDRILDDFPEEMERPQIRKFDPSRFPVILMGVSSPLDPIELTDLLENQIAYRFERLPGVAEVSTWGGFTREIQINIDPEALTARNLTFDVIIERIRRANVNIPVGDIFEGNYELTLRIPGDIQELDQLRNMVIAQYDGRPVRLREIAQVDDTHEKITRIIRINGVPGVRMAVRKQSDANTVEVAQAVLDEIEAVNREFPQLSVVPVINTATFIERSIDNVSRSILYGGGLAILILLIFLRNIRSTIVIALAIPISVIATFALIYFAGFTLNLMTLGGLALGVGMMVDNSIVVLENIFRHRDEFGEDNESAAVKGGTEVSGAIIASTLTTLVIFLPLVFVRGTTGVLFSQLAIVIAFSLACSLLVALSLVPMLASRLVASREEMEARRKGPLRWLADRAERLFQGVENSYKQLIGLILRARVITILVAGLLLYGSWQLVPMIGTEFMPPTDEGEVRVGLVMDIATRVDLVDEQIRYIEQVVNEHVPEITSVVTSVGSSSWRPTGGGEGDIQMSLVASSQRERSNEEIAADLRKRLAGQIPGGEIRIRAPQGLRILNRVIGGDEGISVEIRGFEYETLDLLAAEVAERIEGIEGITDIRLGREAGAPQKMLRIDRERAADLGLSVEQVARTLEAAVSGRRAGDFREAGNQYRILVKIENAEQRSIEEILNLRVTNDRGEPIPLSSVVNVSDARGPVIIDRKDQQRITTVSANIAGRDLGSVAEEILDRVNGIPLPTGYAIALAGSYEEQQEAFFELLLSLILALVLVYMVMACLYESLRDPLVVMFSVPVAAIGVIVVLFLTDTTLNVQSFIGCIMLGGIVVNNAILIVDQAGQLRHLNGMDVRSAVAEAGRRRLRPILMTTLTTMLGLTPLALGIGEGAEAQAPLARAVIGGLGVSTLVTLVLIPAVYSLFHPEPRGADA